ncbi:NAD(P)/FAD-dependent oxidoreductase [Alicyclobacillus tolerans]|uniref:NAD(P)/FAD-dependent oxidoreductase n=1 Tax=Alicyclobacillus tolerans TaxID=90970 RepID=UPI001F23621A|nr:NAD(P)/FAD-dependent oxidoreductase [Alicyclobacillus tolerans]MCF8565286.1 NAD(P)/FAD-dependent oxidoreductase [Alicyclobacillus tolerans]
MAKHVVILGAGYGGIQAALETRRGLTADAAKITIVNREPFHQLITELHQPAAGRLQEKNITIPLDKLLSGKRIGVCLGEVASIQLDKRTVALADGSELKYDILVVALGSESEYFGIEGLKENSFVLKSVHDATRIRSHIEDCIERYKVTEDPADLTFAVGGAGLTGIELIGELADMIPIFCKKHGVDPKNVKLLSVEAMPTILPGFPESLTDRAKASLSARGVEFLTGVPLVKMEPDQATLKDGRIIQTHTMIWTGGVRGHSVVQNSGLEVEPRGRARINDSLQAEGHPEVFVIGDSALLLNKETGRPYPPTAQLAGQMGIHCGQQIYSLLKGGELEPFTPHTQGTLASLGRKDAIGMVGERRLEVTGKPAAWLKEGSKLRYLTQIGGLFARA